MDYRYALLLCIPLSIADSSSVVPLAAGAAAGSVLLLILLCVLALVAVVALKRRMHAQTVDLKGKENLLVCLQRLKIIPCILTPMHTHTV